MSETPNKATQQLRAVKEAARSFIEDLLKEIPGEDITFDEKALLNLAALCADLRRCDIESADKELFSKIKEARDLYTVRAGTCDAEHQVYADVFDLVSDLLDEKLHLCAGTIVHEQAHEVADEICLMAPQMSEHIGPQIVKTVLNALAVAYMKGAEAV